MIYPREWPFFVFLAAISALLTYAYAINLGVYLERTICGTP